MLISPAGPLFVQRQLIISSAVRRVCTWGNENQERVAHFLILILQRGGYDSVGPYDQTLTSTSPVLAFPIFQAFHAK